MKKTLIIAFLLLVGVANAQKIHEKRAEFYATEAAKYFNLNESQKQLVYTTKLKLLLAQVAMNKKKKSGELEEEDVANYKKEHINPLAKDVIAALGFKNYEEIKPFNDKVHPKMYKMK